MGWIQTSAKNFSESAPHKLFGIEVWEPSGFEGEMLHLKSEGGIEVPRANRTVYETEADATREWERPFPARDYHAVEMALRRQDAKELSDRGTNR